jgi:diguanylate cyclase (GGDEF)-like protein
MSDERNDQAFSTPIPMQTQVQAQALASAPYGAFICAQDGTFLYVNAAFEQLTAYRADELIGQRGFRSLLDPAELARRGTELPGAAVDTGADAGMNGLHAQRYEREWVCVRRNNTRISIMLALTPLKRAERRVDGRPANGRPARSSGTGWPDGWPGNGAGNGLGIGPAEASEPRHGAYVGMAIEMTRHAQSEARLWYAENHDGVTRLPNQTLFAERLDLTIARCRRGETGFTVLLAEVNSLRKLRDALGSHAAELVLQIVGQRLRGVIGYEGTIASVSGTQFALLVNETGAAADALATTALARIAAPIDCAGTTLNLTASLGCATYPEDGADSPSLMRRANVALSAATAAGGNLVRRFSTALDGQAARRFELETMLREALERQQLHLVYQPQITLATGQLAQVETLLRWTHPKRGPISPAEFVPVAEETGLIDQIGEWVIRTACRDAGRLLRLTGNLPRVAINVSPQQFRRRNLLAIIESALHDAALDPSYIEVEITEGVLLGDTEDALQTLHALRKLGVEVAVDDFGTGYSSLAYLTRFPLNRLKIDRSFVVRMTTDAQSAALVGAIIAMAHALKLRVTAEGVETEEQAARLAELGCDEVQGFWFARPLSLSALRNLLAPLGQEGAGAEP